MNRRLLELCRSLRWTLVPLLLLPLARTAWSESAESGTRPAIQGGREIYTVHCAPCHGVSGKGDGEYVPKLEGPPPRDFTYGLFKYRSTTGRATPEDLARTIRRGLAGTEMPGFHRMVTETEALQIAEFILSLSPPAETDDDSEPFSLPDETPDDEASRARGRLFYLEDCASCHGKDGKGDGPRSGELVSKWGHPVRPRDLTEGVYQGGSTDADIYRSVATGLEGIPMPPQGFLREPEEIWDLVHYLRTLEQHDDSWWELLEPESGPPEGGR